MIVLASMRRFALAAVTAGLVWPALMAIAAAQSFGPAAPQASRPPPRYDRIDAGLEAYQRAEQERARTIGRQLEVNQRLAWYAGAGGVYYYGFPRFEPWPFVPGDLFGYPYVDRVQQPLGHEIVVTGVNGYIYRPVYPPAPAVLKAGTAKPQAAEGRMRTPPPPPLPAPPASSVPAPPAPAPPNQGPRDF